MLVTSSLITFTLRSVDDVTFLLNCFSFLLRRSFLLWVFLSQLLIVLNYSVQRDSRRLVTSSLMTFPLRSVDDVTFLLNCFSFLLRRSFLLWVFLSQLLFVLDSSHQRDSRMLVSRSLMTFTLSC